MFSWSLWILLLSLLLFLVAFPLPVSPLQDELSALATAKEVNYGSWIPHRGHGETKWLTWLPNSFKQDGSDLYLFEAKDFCRCSKHDAKGLGLDVLFLGGDPTRLLAMAIQQLFHREQPFEVHRTPEDCDTHRSRPDSPCGHLIMNPMNHTHCDGTLNLWSINFERLLRTENITELLEKHLQIACGRQHNVAVIIDIRRVGIVNMKQYQEMILKVTEDKSLVQCSKLLTFAHNAYQVVNTGTSSHSGDSGDNAEDFVSDGTLRKFHDHQIPFFNFHGIYQNFSDSVGIRQVEDVNSFKYLQSQILLNTICEIDPHQTMLFGSRVGSFQLKEQKRFVDGQLVKASESKEIDLFKNGSLHTIPNWDTFVKLGFKMENVKSIKSVDLDAMNLPKGDPLPPCTDC